ncbi:hypothetical protein ACBJ59_58135 [Nonomuraea sp. MTCD27]|uniref:hypothetical protein n=1 Tax=Nonomuraea sp. MTCD27 TaxID=1676747 RepID=UPI0035C05EBE
MTAAQSADDRTGLLADQLDLLTTIDEFLRSPAICDRLAAFLTARNTPGPTGNARFAACTVIDLFSFTVAGLCHQPRDDPGHH